MPLLDFAAALDGARTLAHVDELARAFWGATGDGRVADADAERVAARIAEARRRIQPAGGVPARAPHVLRAVVSAFPPRNRRCVSPDRQASRARRRRLAYSGPMPPALASGFTLGQLAALRIVADEVRDKGACTLTLAEIAARAGVCVSTARNAIRLAVGDGLAINTERRQHGRPSLPNVVRVISLEWLQWIKRRGVGCRNANPKDTKDLKPTNGGAAASGSARKTFDGKGGAQPKRQGGQIRHSQPGLRPLRV
jgi:hypothetical protein